MHLTNLIAASGSEFTVSPSIWLAIGTVVAVAAFIGMSVLFVVLVRFINARTK